MPPRRVFRQEGEYWTIEYAGVLCRLRDCSGLRQLADLLAQPGQAIPATELLRRHGRSRPEAVAPRARATPEVERARVSVTRAIRAVLGRLAVHHPALVEHLNATVRTGTLCAYAPDPRLGAAWER